MEQIWKHTVFDTEKLNYYSKIKNRIQARPTTCNKDLPKSFEKRNGIIFLKYLSEFIVVCIQNYIFFIFGRSIFQVLLKPVLIPPSRLQARSSPLRKSPSTKNDKFEIASPKEKILRKKNHDN